MLNVRDYVVKVNDELVIPVARRTFMGTVLEYTTSNGKRALYSMDKYEEDHAQNITIIGTVKSEIKYQLM